MTLTRSVATTFIIAVVLTLLFWGPLWWGYGFVGGDLYPYFFPQKAFFSDRLHAGEFPLWNNLNGFGYPVLGESQTGAAYPPHVVAYYWLDVNTAYNVEHLLHYVLCFVATWLFARRVGLGASGSALMALVFTYGWFPPRACLEWAIVTGAWLPVALWCVESFLQTRWWRYAIGLSLALGLQLLAGHFHLAFITQMVVVAYGGWRLCGSGCFVSALVPSPRLCGERARVRGPSDEYALHAKWTSASQPSTINSQPLTGSPPHPNPLPPKAGGEGTGQGKAEEPLTLTLSPQGRDEGTRRRLVAPMLVLVSSIVAGFLLAAVQLLPAWELKTRSSRAAVGGEHDPAYGHLPPLYVSQLVAPFWWYSPIANQDNSLIRDVAEFGAPWHWFGPHHDLEAAVQQTKFGALRTGTNKVEAHLYCGLVPLGLAIWWVLLGRKPRAQPLSGGRKSPGSSRRKQTLISGAVVDETSERGGVSPLVLQKRADAQEPGDLRPPLGMNVLGMTERGMSARGEVLFWTIAGLIALVYATGWLLPVARYIPGFNFFRGPGRYGIVTTWAIALLAARGFEALLERRELLGRRVVIGLVFWSTCGDLWLVSRMVTNVVMVSHPAISFREQSHVRKLLLAEPLAPRLYCPGQNVGTLLGVSCLPVYLGIAPKEYADAKFSGAGMPKPTSDGSPILADDEFSRWLRSSGVTHVLSFDPLDESSWHATRLWKGIDEMLNRAWGRREPIYLYRLQADESGELPSRVWLPALLDDHVRNEPATAVVRAQREANQIVVDVDTGEGGVLGLRELEYPDWSVSTKKEPSVAGSHGFRFASVPGGVQRITWTYRPRSVMFGAAISLLTLLALATIAHVRFWHRDRLDRHLVRWFSPRAVAEQNGKNLSKSGAAIQN